MLTKGAIGNLVNRYRAVLKKCNLINVFGSLAVASILVLGGAGVAEAVEYTQGDTIPSQDSYTGDKFHDITKTSGNGGVFDKESLTLSDVHFVDNKLDKIGHAYGGAIHATVNLTIDESDFSRNKAITDATGISNNTACGGAIYTKGVTKITSTTFTENSTHRNHTNSGASNGGAIYSTKDITLRDCTFTSNNAYHHGGAVAAQKILNIYDSEFNSNSANALGGAVWLSKATVEVTGTDFTGNTSKLHGGAIYQNGGSLEFTNVNFTGNKKLTNSGVSGADTDGGGGAIAVQPNGTTSLSFAGTNVFKENYSELDGGAIHVGIGNSSSTATMTFEEGSDNQFIDNVSGRFGGAIFNDTDGRMAVNADLVFTGNEDSTGKNDVRNDGLMTITDAKVTLDGGISSSKDDSGKFTGIITGSGEAVIRFTQKQTKVQASQTTGVKAVASKELNDVLGGNIEDFKRMLLESNGLEFGGMEGGGMVAPQVKPDGTKETNVVMDSVLKQASITTFALDRILTNDVRKRLGDIRSDANQTGVWMRWDGGKLKNTGLTNNFNTIQIGGDTKVAKNCRLGVAGSFTHGDGDFSRGSSELEGFSFAAYATWMGENGMFADIVARLGHFSTEMKVEGREGDMNNRVASLSGEYGWRFNLCEQFFIEPQLELAYTYVSSEDLQLREAKYQFDDVDSLTARAGLVAGWNLPNEMGSVYARASVVQQFMGDAKVTGSITDGKPVIHELDGEDTWLEYGIGANIKFTDKTYLWADVERTEGAKIEEEWRGTVGLRVSF